MKSVIQRVTQASVKVDDQTIASIDMGCLILLGIEKSDDVDTAAKLARKISQYRIFSDENGKMNLNIKQVQGTALVVSQFTLVADTSQGNRPGFSKGASPDQGRILYHAFTDALVEHDVEVQTGQFAADMQISLTNDGPVTFCINT